MEVLMKDSECRCVSCKIQREQENFQNTKGNTTNLMSHLKATHLKKYKEARQKTVERRQNYKQTSSNQRKSQLASQVTLREENLAEIQQCFVKKIMRRLLV